MASMAGGAPDKAAPFPGARRAALRQLLPYLWPAGAWDLRIRVLLALVCLAIAKFANVIIPLIFKGMVDALTVKPGSAAVTVLAVPVMLLLAYGAARISTQAFAELRDGIFVKVAQRAIRRVALQTFEHLHSLSLRFHLERQTGGLSRIVERGAKGIEFFLFFVLFNVLPTLVEIALVCGILWGLYNFWFAFVTFVTIAGYVAYTLTVTEWRIKYRRYMNQADEEANTKAIDSLLNYETVKYFNNEGHESRRYDVALQAYEKAGIKSRVTLSVLNTGQAFIIAVGVTLIMALAARGVVAGTMTIGDFVLVNAYLIQLYLPLNFLGTVYREIRQSLIDMEKMFSLLNVPVEIQDRAGAPPLKIDRAGIVFDNVMFGYDDRRPILKGVSFAVPPGKTVAIVGPSGAGKSTISRLLFRFYDVNEGSIAIDGQDLRDVQQSSLRAAIGIVPQDTVLFNDTVYYNIAYGRPSATREEVEAGREAGAHPRFRQRAARRLQVHGGRARAETLRRREAARRHRPHHPETAGDPAVRRGHLGAGHPHREGDPDKPARGLRRPHHPDHRPPALHGDPCRRDHRAGRRPHRRTRPPRRPAGQGRQIRRHVGQAAGSGGEGRAEAGGGNGAVGA